MITTDSLKIYDKTSVMYMPLMPYGNAFCHILSNSNNKNMCKVILSLNKKPDDSETPDRTYWAKKFAYDHAGENGYYPARHLDRYEMKFNPEEVFSFLTNAMKTDKELIDFINAYGPSSKHDLD